MTVGRFKFVVWFNDLTEDEMFEAVSEMNTKYGWTYYHAAHEIAPTTGNHHLDGYYELATQRKFNTELKKWQKKFGKGFGDLQIAKGTAGENCDYSEKEGRRQECKGEPGKGQGERKDLNAVKDEIMTGKRSVDEITTEDPLMYHQYGRTLNRLQELALRKQFRTEMPKVTWAWGPTGVGKSHWLLKGFNPDTHYIWKEDNGWQDGYTGQKIILMNEFRGGIPYSELLQILDKWPYYLRRRNKEPAPLLAVEIKITSSMPPEQVYNGIAETDNINQLLRRVTVKHCLSRLDTSLLD